MRIVLQHFLIVVRFNHERLHLAQAFDQHFRGITKIGNETQPAVAGVKSESDWIDCVVWDWKCLHDDVANREFGAGMKDSPVSMSIQRTAAADGFGGQSVTVDGQGKFSAKDLQPANMVAVLMRKQDAIELVRCQAALLEP